MQTRSGMIVTFLAILEMIRLKLIRVFQSARWAAFVPARRPADAPKPSETQRRPSESLKPIVEALIFASPEPVTPKTLYKLLDGETRKTSMRPRGAARRLRRPRGLQMVERGGYQIVTRPELHEWCEAVPRSDHAEAVGAVARDARGHRLQTAGHFRRDRRDPWREQQRRSALDADRARLIKAVGRKQVVGRPFMYATTREFLERFGLSDLSDLPKVEELSDALGFELPGGLAELTQTTSPLPFEAEAAPERVRTESVSEHPVGTRWSPKKKKRKFTRPMAERLQKILSAAGIASRRTAETLIEQGRVTVNGRTVTELGTKAIPTRTNRVDGRRVKGGQRRRYILLYKPRAISPPARIHSTGRRSSICWRRVA